MRFHFLEKSVNTFNQYSSYHFFPSVSYEMLKGKRFAKNSMHIYFFNVNMNLSSSSKSPFDYKYVHFQKKYMFSKKKDPQNKISFLF